MIKRLKNGLAFSMAAMLLFTGGNVKEGNQMKDVKEKDMAVFHINLVKREIKSVSKNFKDHLKFKFHSVTTDQPIYWPDEDVFVKIVMPARPGGAVDMTVQKKDSAPDKPEKVTLNPAGIAVESIMSGKVRKMEPGEYRVDVKTADGTISDFATFTVVEGVLGALSFGYEFQQVTSAEDLEKNKGAWFMGNASGMGKRWGNGLNVKNELRTLNQPYSGEITIKSKCYLPGCDGVEAGPEVKMEITDGKLEAMMDVGGHSGPFAIEVITKNGNVSTLFGKSGHVERQPIVISQGLGNNFSATLAPYENTVPVPGREIYTSRDSESESPVLLASPVTGADKTARLEIRKSLENPKIVVCAPVADDEFQIDEVKSPNPLKKGSTVSIPCRSPYSLIGIGGFEGNEYFEGWAIVFTPTAILVELEAPPAGAPNRPAEILVKTMDLAGKKGIPVYGILEVFDNRVQSKSAKEPLVSTLGNSIREFSNYFVSWRDITGIDEYQEMKAEEAMAPPLARRAYAAKNLGIAPAPAMGMAAAPGAEGAAGMPEAQEEVREGEKKVLYCGIVRTDGSGKAAVSVVLPPQTGRCKIRFTAVDRYEYAEEVKDIDVKKASYIEVQVMPLLMPGAAVTARATVVNSGRTPVRLTIAGAGLENTINQTFPQGITEYEFRVSGKTYGKLELALSDSAGKGLDRREIGLRNVGAFPVTYSDLMISDGKAVTVAAGSKAAVYSNPGMLLNGMVMNVVTSLYSWFGHAEALSSAAAIRAVLLAAIDEKIVNDEGLRETLASDLVKAVKDLDEIFYDRKARLFRPYPGTDTDPMWSLWTIKNLSLAAERIEGSAKLKAEFGETAKRAREMVENTYKALEKRKIDAEGETLYDFEKGREVLPVEINGKVVYKLITDAAVVDWFLSRMYRGMDMDPSKPLSRALIIDYDRYRFLRSLERTGEIYYLVQNARALYTQNKEEFIPLFNRIARGVIQTQEPGVIKGPALLGGVYSSPLTVAPFLDLLLAMARDNRFDAAFVKAGGKKVSLAGGPALLEAKADLTLEADPYTVIRIDRQIEIDMMDFTDRTSFFKVSVEKGLLSMGGETSMTVELEKDRDPVDYYAIIAAPSTVSVKQTEDLLSDYTGRLIYGQRETGGGKIQALTVPFRGSRKIVLKLGAEQKGESEGFVLVRHMSNPDIISTVKVGKVTVE